MQISKPKKGFKLVDAGFRKYKEIPEKWDYDEFQYIIKKDKAKILEIQTSGYQNQGKIPIVDQGQDLICGYTDDSSLIYSGELPVIVFGDHTLAVKFIDFPFAVGADGTKIIQINKEKGLTKFFYYAILNSNLTSEGYKRHFIKLREQKLCYPSIIEQEKIVNVISTADSLIQKITKQVEQTKLLRNGLINTLMKKGIGHSKFKTVVNFFKKEFEIPSSWDYVPFSSVVKVNPTTSGTSKKINHVPMDAVNVDSPDLDYFETRPVEEVEHLQKFKQNDVLFARITPSTENGKTALIGELSGVGYASSELTVLRPGSRVIPSYLYYYVKSHKVRQFAISQMLGTTGRQRVPDYVFKKDLKFDLPSVPEQKQIVKIISNIDSLIQNQKQIKLTFENCMKGLMQKLLTGKLRIKF